MNRYVVALAAVLMTNGFAQVHFATARQTPGTTDLQATSQISGSELDKDIIPGRWSFHQAKHIVLAKLQEAQKRSDRPLCRTDACDAHHEVLGQFSLHYRSRESVILIADSPDPENNCHACGPPLSLFEFEKSKDAWVLVDEEIGFRDWGNWGAADPKGIKFSQIGNDRYALLLYGGATGQGYFEEVVLVHVRLRDKYQEVLNAQLLEDDANTATPGRDHWNAVFKIVPSKGPFYDIVVTRSGVREGKRCSETERFKFNGKKYVSTP
jgi:hypothetical protein